ncbi:fasciclin domain-containing protein [Paraflavisolibacter sp. H34]|uniref:fasciclin domain-containing protein n=1 Tax=Huijunlia imazamoxiresistens TaxID=3127457 RepID=UPI0030194115
MRNNNISSVGIRLRAALLALPLVLLAGLQACKKDRFSYQVNERQVLMLDMIRQDTSLSLAVQALEKAKMAPTLNTYGPFTFFAPDNNAFRKLFAVQGKKGLEDFSEEELRTIMTYHILPTRLKASEFVQGPQGTATGRGDFITLDVSKGYKYNTLANGVANVYQTDIEYANGFLHKMDAVLNPPTLTIGQFLEQNPDQYSILVGGLRRAGMLDTLTALTDAQNNRIRLTLFAETNDVLKAAGVSSYDNMPVDELRKLLRNHIIAGSNFSSSYTKFTPALPGLKVVERWDSTILTLDRQDWLYFNLAGKNLINETANFAASDVIMRNGMVHNVDKPLSFDPPSKRTQIYHKFWTATNFAYGIPGFTSTQPPVANASSGNWRYYFEGTPGHPRGENFLFMNADTPGDSLVTVVKNIKRGKYRIEMSFKNGNRGTFQLKCGDDLIGVPVNYGNGLPVSTGSVPTFEQKLAVGSYTFKTSGDQRLAFVCTVAGGLNVEAMVLTPEY